MRPCTVSHAVGQRVSCARCRVSTCQPAGFGAMTVHVDGADVDVGHALDLLRAPNATHTRRAAPAQRGTECDRHPPRHRSRASTVASTTRPCVVAGSTTFGVVSQQAHMLAGRARPAPVRRRAAAGWPRPPASSLDATRRARESAPAHDGDDRRRSRSVLRVIAAAARAGRSRLASAAADARRGAARALLTAAGIRRAPPADARRRRSAVRIGDGGLHDLTRRLGGDATQLVDRRLAAANEREARFPERNAAVRARGLGDALGSRASGDSPLELGRRDEDLGDRAPTAIARLAAVAAPCPGARHAQSAARGVAR